MPRGPSRDLEAGALALDEGAGGDRRQPRRLPPEFGFRNASLKRRTKATDYRIGIL